MFSLRFLSETYSNCQTGESQRVRAVRELPLQGLSPIPVKIAIESGCLWVDIQLG
jgi:hypothetical protein